MLWTKKEFTYTCLQNGIYYTPNLANVILILNKDSEVVNYLKEQEKEIISLIAVEGLESGIVYTDNLSSY